MNLADVSLLHILENSENKYEFLARDYNQLSRRNRHSESEEEMEIDLIKKPHKVTAKDSVRLRVVHSDEIESNRALRMLTVANSATSRISEREAPRSKMRMDMIGDTEDKSQPPPEPVNNLSRLVSPNAAPKLQPVLIKNLKSNTNKGNALKRLGPQKQMQPKQSAMSRLDQGANGRGGKNSTVIGNYLFLTTYHL